MPYAVLMVSSGFWISSVIANLKKRNKMVKKIYLEKDLWLRNVIKMHLESVGHDDLILILFVYIYIEIFSKLRKYF